MSQVLYLMLHLPMQEKRRALAMEQCHLRSKVYVVFLITLWNHFSYF